jgi:hypothetical protein
LHYNIKCFNCWLIWILFPISFLYNSLILFLSITFLIIHSLFWSVKRVVFQIGKWQEYESGTWMNLHVSTNLVLDDPTHKYKCGTYIVILFKQRMNKKVELKWDCRNTLHGHGRKYVLYNGRLMITSNKLLFNRGRCKLSFIMILDNLIKVLK